MAGTPLTQAEANRVIDSRKRIDGDIGWDYDPSRNQTWARFEKDVVNDLGLNLRVYGNANLVVPKSSFALVLNGAFRLVGLDVNGSHANKHTNNQEWRGQTHKVRWTDRCRDRLAFTPGEAIPDDLGCAFREFCAECRIEFVGRVKPLPELQLSLNG